MSLAERFSGPEGRHTLFEALSRQELLMGKPNIINEIIDRSEIITYPQGSTLIEQDGDDRHILFLLSGETIIHLNGTQTTSRRSAGNHIGEMALVDPMARRSATVTAAIETVVLKVEPADFCQIAETDAGLWKGIAVELARRLRERNTMIQPGKRLVLLIHGIRTQAEWQDMVKAELQDINTKVVPIKYGILELVCFWFPFFTRTPSILETERKIQRAIYDHQGYEVVIIAHSFGTHAVSKILKKNPLLRISRMILCGCIIRRKYLWDQLPNRPSIILNDCGVSDIYPILACSTTLGYGATGVFGFGTTEVEDRFFNCGHSGFFEKDFVIKYWKPFVESGFIETSPIERSITAWWKSHFRKAVSLVVILLVLSAWAIRELIIWFH